MPQDQGEFIYELKKPMMQRILPIVLTLIFIYIAAVYWPIVSLVGNSDNNKTTASNITALVLIAIITAVISYMIYATLRYFSHSYFLKIYERGVYINRRRECDKYPPPESYKDIITKKSYWDLKLDELFISIKDIHELYAIKLKPERMLEKGGYIVMIENSGKWYLFGIPHYAELEEALKKLGEAFGPYKWKRIYSGIY
jgi:uncharacterized membrane protein